MTPPPVLEVSAETPAALLERPLQPGPAPLRERRTSQRLQVRGLWCDRGQAVDFSPRGMRLVVRRRWPEGMARTIRLHLGDEVHEVTARCIWCRQDGMFTHSVGVAFDDISPEAQAALERWMVG